MQETPPPTQESLQVAEYHTFDLLVPPLVPRSIFKKEMIRSFLVLHVQLSEFLPARSTDMMHTTIKSIGTWVDLERQCLPKNSQCDHRISFCLCG